VANVRPWLLLCDKLFRLSVNSRALVAGYLVVALAADSVRYQLEIDATGASNSMQNISQETLRRLILAIPPPAEQLDILEFLDRETAKIDGLVAKKQRLIDLLLEKRSALITRVVTRGLDANVPMKDSGVDWLGQIPAHWEVSRLGEAMQLVMDFRGRTPLKLSMNWGGDIPAISAVNVRDGHIDLSRGVNYGSKKLHDRWMTQGPTHRGDIVFTTEAPLGNVAMVPDDGQYILSQRVVMLRSRPKRIKPEYLFQFLKSPPFRQGIESRATGSTAEGVKRRHLMSMAVCVPPIDEQAAISAWLVDQVNAIERVVPTIQEAIGLVGEFRIALISAAVTGKIDVRQEVT
jgi:type I restriction enzyme S subunit